MSQYPGQHMLRTVEPFRELLGSIDLMGRTVIEVGVGTGVLTRLILESRPREVIGFEIDPTICRLVHPRFELHIGDFRHAELPPIDARTCLISAPPYDLLSHLLPLVDGREAVIFDAILMAPESRLGDVRDFDVAFDLGPNDFDPPTNPGRHYVVRRGFRTSFPT